MSDHAAELGMYDLIPDDIVWVARSHRGGAETARYHTRWMCLLPSRSIEGSGRIPTSVDAAITAGFIECKQCARGLPIPDNLRRALAHQ